jgi:hypothetical protein
MHCLRERGSLVRGLRNPSGIHVTVRVGIEACRDGIRTGGERIDVGNNRPGLASSSIELALSVRIHWQSNLAGRQTPQVKLGGGETAV